MEHISRFRCRDSEVERFLKEKSFIFEKRDISRTYLIISDEGALMGYYTLSLKALPFDGSVSKSMIKDIDGYSKNVNAVGIVMIGQLGKDMLLAGSMDGAELLDACMRTVHKVRKLAGGRFVMLECQDRDKVVSFYKRYGFHVLQKSKNRKYLQMIRKL